MNIKNQYPKADGYVMMEQYIFKNEHSLTGAKKKNETRKL